MKINNKGSSLLILIFTFTVLIIFVAGWYVWSQNNQQSNNNESMLTNTENTNDSQNSEIGADDRFLDPTDFIESYKVPEGWEEKECKPGLIALTPPGVPSPKCNADQPSTTITIGVENNFDYIDPESCEHTKPKRLKNFEGTDWFVSYTCEELSVGGKLAIKEVIEENERGMMGVGTNTVYNFPASGSLLTFRYQNIKENNNKNYESIFDEIVKSVKFR